MSNEVQSDPMRNLTLIVLEVPWTEKFTVSDQGFRPGDSVLPLLNAFCVTHGARIIHRAVHDPKDFERWCDAFQGAHLGTRILWIAAHGAASRKGRAYLCLLEEKELRVDQIKKGLEAASVDGVVLDACHFGKNDPEEWLPDKSGQPSWALAYRNSIWWNDSLFFGLKTLDWLYGAYGHDRGSQFESGEAARRYWLGLRTGRVRAKERQIDLKPWADGLGARFFHRKQKKGWTDEAV